jgi:opacity protein-like surface antigen
MVRDSSICRVLTDSVTESQNAAFLYVIGIGTLLFWGTLMKKLLSTTLLSLICLIGVNASAQKNEFAAEASGQFPSADNLSFDPAVGYQLNYAHRLLGAPGVGIYVEVPFVAGFNNQRTLTSLFTGQDYNSLYFTPGIKVKLLPSFFLSPYFAGGIGLAHFSASNAGGSENDFAIDVGGGLDMKVFPHLSLRGEVRDFITDTPGLNLDLLQNFTGKTNNVVVSGGVVLRF